MAVTWLPNQASFIGALDAGAQAGLRSAALQQQAMAQQAAIDEANARRQAAEIEAQNRLNFEAWLRGEQMRQQAAQDEMMRDKYNEELGYKKQQLEKTMATEAAKQSYWNNRGTIVPQGSAFIKPSGEVTIPSPRPEPQTKPVYKQLADGQWIQIFEDGSTRVINDTKRPPPSPLFSMTMADYNSLLDRQEKLNIGLTDPKTAALSTKDEMEELRRKLAEVNNQLDMFRKAFGQTNVAPSITATNAPPGLSLTNAVARPKLDADTAMRFLRDTKGDKDLARKLARDAGYSF